MGRIAYFSLLTAIVVSYTATYGQQMNTLPVLCAVNQKTPNIINQLDLIPHGAQHQKEVVIRAVPEPGFHAVLALMQAVTVLPCSSSSDSEAKVTLRNMHLIEQDPKNGNENIVAEVNFQQNAPVAFDGALFPRLPHWYAENNGGSKETNITRQTDDGLEIDLSLAPQEIYHGWTNPKVSAKEGMRYIVEVEAKIVGAARLQIGVDYWRELNSGYNTFDLTCQTSNNCEGYVTKWFGPTGGDFQTIRVPDAFIR